MAIRTHQGVAKATERLAGRSVGAASKRIRRGLEPLIRDLKNAKSLAGLKKAVGRGALKRMPTEASAEALAETMVQVGLAARVAARPSDVATKRRSDEGGRRRRDEG